MLIWPKQTEHIFITDQLLSCIKKDKEILASGDIKIEKN